MSSTQYSPIHLQVVNVEFTVGCRVQEAGATERLGVFSVLTLLDGSEGLVDHFYVLTEAVISVLGDNPDPLSVSRTLERMAIILQRASSTPQRTLTGLFGELFVISMSKSPTAMLDAWHIDTSNRYDFHFPSVRVEVKTTTRRERRHTFTYEQCNPPQGQRAAVLSLMTERVASGETIWDLVERIAATAGSRPDLTLKLHQAVADTLGKTFAESHQVRFDTGLARESLALFDAGEIPALREQVPAGVTSVTFVSDLTSAPRISSRSLASSWPTVSQILP